jgi:hypothetical protein
MLPPFVVASVVVDASWLRDVPPVTCLPFSSLNPAFSTMDLKRRCLVHDPVSLGAQHLFMVPKRRTSKPSYSFIALGAVLGPDS